MKPPLVLIEVGNPDGLDDPVVTKEDHVTVVSINWEQPMHPSVLGRIVRTLEEYRGEHPRIDLVLERLRQRPPRAPVQLVP
ncbi:MAG TPA: hypothetical protein VGR13_04610 [Actinomycetota bacterium]|nr:hypothetical protein [Actinomycetota bacterium]